LKIELKSVDAHLCFWLLAWATWVTGETFVYLSMRNIPMMGGGGGVWGGMEFPLLIEIL
jgi:hypothetical protein